MRHSDPSPVDVAVGVLIRPDGRFLLAQRPLGKPMAGYWEFPGGKLEHGEDVLSALRREFLEELGVRIETAFPWVVRVVHYPHATVRLHFCRCYSWHGEPTPLEGQIVRWEQLDVPLVEPWLPGALPLRRWLALPPHYAISQATELGIETFLERLDARFAQGHLRLLQLREPHLDAKTFEALFTAVLARARAARCRILVNSRHPDAYWARADGVHLTEAALMARTTRPAVAYCAASCHDSRALAKAGALELDFAVLGPVQATASHPDARTLGWQEFRAILRHATLPVYALGGLKRSDLPSAIESGAHGIAAMRASWI